MEHCGPGSMAGGKETCLSTNISLDKLFYLTRDSTLLICICNLIKASCVSLVFLHTDLFQRSEPAVGLYGEQSGFKGRVPT